MFGLDLKPSPVTAEFVLEVAASLEVGSSPVSEQPQCSALRQSALRSGLPFLHLRLPYHHPPAEDLGAHTVSMNRSRFRDALHPSKRTE
jgi:hypothetical protein